MINRLVRRNRRPAIMEWDDNRLDMASDRRMEKHGKGMADLKIINSSRLLRMQATVI